MILTIMLSKRLVVTLALLLAALLVIALLASGLILHPAHLASGHLFADSSTPNVIIHNH
jgi:hypothetical protein